MIAPHVPAQDTPVVQQSQLRQVGPQHGAGTPFSRALTTEKVLGLLSEMIEVRSNR